MPDGGSRQGYVLSFSGEVTTSLHRREAKLRFDGGPVPLVEVSAARLRGWCFGELLSYNGDGSTKTCLMRAISDFSDGRLAPRQLNGRFLMLIREDVQDEWTIITDRVGAMHAYGVWEGERAKAIGSDLLIMTGYVDTSQLDWEAITAFCAMGYFPQNRSHYPGIRLLEPASVYRFSDDGRLVDHKIYATWQYNPRHDRSYGQTVDEYDSLLRQAVDRCTRDGYILPLSGGLDSRSLAAMLPRGAETMSYSYGYSRDSVETRIAGQIARSRQFTFTHHTVDEYLFDRLGEISRTLHGLQDAATARQMSITGWLAQQGGAVLTGLWGDVWCDQMGLADGLPAGMSVADHTYKKMAKRGRKWLMDNLCKPQVIGEPEQIAFDVVEQGLAPFSAIEDIDWRVKAFKTANWCFRWSNASLRGFDPGGLPRIPYYDVDLMDFFCTVPTDMVRDRRIQIDHLKRYAPDLARIPWQAAETNLYLAPIGLWVSLPRRVFNRVKRSVSGKKVLERNWERQFLSDRGRAGLQQWLLDDGLPLHNIMDKTAIHRLLADFHSQPDPSNGYAVSMLLSLSAWLALSRPDGKADVP